MTAFTSGLIASIRLIAISRISFAVISFLLTRVEIAVGRSTSEDGPCYAWIGRNYEPTTHNNVGVDRNKRPQPEDYQEFSSLEEMGDEAVRVFSHHYTVDVMGI